MRSFRATKGGGLENGYDAPRYADRPRLERQTSTHHDASRHMARRVIGGEFPGEAFVRDVTPRVIPRKDLPTPSRRKSLAEESIPCIIRRPRPESTRQ